MYKRISFWFWIFLLAGCAGSERESDAATEAETPETRVPRDSGNKVIIFFGNSLTAGYGLEMSEAYPAVIQAKIDSLGLDYTVVNAGVSGETTASGASRVDWVLESVVDIFVLELGGNDGLRGIPVDETTRNLQAIIDKVKASSPETKIVLAGMQVPPNMGKAYADEFAAVYPALARKNDIYLIPFLLERVGGERTLNLADGIHPTAEGQRLVAENVWEILRDIL